MCEIVDDMEEFVALLVREDDGTVTPLPVFAPTLLLAYEHARTQCRPNEVVVGIVPEWAVTDLEDHYVLVELGKRVEEAKEEGHGNS